MGCVVNESDYFENCYSEAGVFYLSPPDDPLEYVRVFSFPAPPPGVSLPPPDRGKGGGGADRGGTKHTGAWGDTGGGEGAAGGSVGIAGAGRWVGGGGRNKGSAGLSGGRLKYPHRNVSPFRSRSSER